MERDKFCCSKCGKKGQLQVHHVRTLRSIIGKVLNNEGIKSIKDVDLADILYEQLIEKVVSEHVLSDGITLCRVCHGEIDERYRRYKGEGKKNLQREV